MFDGLIRKKKKTVCGESHHVSSKKNSSTKAVGKEKLFKSSFFVDERINFSGGNQPGGFWDPQKFVELAAMDESKLELFLLKTYKIEEKMRFQPTATLVARISK